MNYFEDLIEEVINKYYDENESFDYIAELVSRELTTKHKHFIDYIKSVNDDYVNIKLFNDHYRPFFRYNKFYINGDDIFNITEAD